MIPTLNDSLIAFVLVVGFALGIAAYLKYIDYMLKLFFPKYPYAYYICCFIPFGLFVTYLLALAVGAK